MTLNVQNFLRGAGMTETADGTFVPGDKLAGLALLASPLFGIKVKQHPTFKSLYHFSYDQIESPKGHPIVNECRGLILDSDDDWKVVAMPFIRFANLGESWAAPIDWNTVRVQDKVDGSLMIVWAYGGQWNVSTKGSPDASGQVGDFDFNFAQLFWKTLASYGIDPVQHLDSRLTYMMELTSIYNRVVCAYGKDPALTLIGVRDMTDLNEMHLVSHFALTTLAIPHVREYPLTSIAEIEAAAIALDPIQNEGFVVVDGNFNRIKMKSPSYVMIHHMKDGFGQRRIIRLIQLGESSEVLSYFPEYQDLYNEIEAKVEAWLQSVQDEFDGIKHITDRKEFALMAQKTKNIGIHMSLFLGQAANVRELVLHAKKVVKKATATDPATEDFKFRPEQIEEMVGLKTRLDFSVAD